MQDENLQEKDMLTGMSIEDLFLKSQESYETAQARAAEENKGFAKTEFFRMEKLGTYCLRVLPIAPNPDGTIDRNGYEYPIHQMLLELEKPSKSNKAQYAYVTVPRTTDAGYSVDLIDTYRKMAVSEAKDNGNEKMAEKIAGGSFGGGLKFSYGHATYILDLDERAKGIQLLTLSHSQFKDLDERKFKLWQKKLAKNPSYPCPISSIANAYPVEIEKKKNNSKTEYAISIDNEADTDTLSKEELTALLNTPRIPEIIFRYSRYQFGATVEFLKQCDNKYNLNIMDSEEMKEAIAKLSSELSKEDTSEFTFDKRSKDAKENAENSTVSIDSLFDKFEDLQEQGLGDKTEEGQELRGLIRAFIEQEHLSVRITRSTSNQELLDMIEEAMQGGDKTSKDTQTQVVQETGSEEQGSEETGSEEEDKPRTARDRRRRE
ncbi:hypothetical protein [Bacteroides salyersiae]|uniref:Uncharacterized protein n=1 Tax=Bacteroides salyersiae TaxID=291644 RepID=A0A7J4XI71_9BACE|nr:hypothetical protein [Bacteroides salyersiae]KAA3691869.1 hypothetical protein F3F90_11640 [Bacteroides salyersiae]KAA3694617.1 hypothetical protein F3F88_17390 [Bacteroides salyersiae]KAA3695970.1 hypothetical protein F3F89_13755 [Bacteroides salyersiae]KAA3703088.1 hypothetical protein F3G09_21185 [Bacteroides salyersiae]KAA3704291.1 hypothetical protein F3F83_17530 [Bacteroides salyersiae]